MKRFILLSAFVIAYVGLSIFIDHQGQSRPVPTPVATSTITATETATETATPTETPVPPTPTPIPTPTPLPESFIATRYGESYNGLPMGCVGSGLYSSANASILAAPPSRYVEWPCGTVLSVCYEQRCQEVVRTDSCPGCGMNHIDLSEAGLWYLAQCRCDVLQDVTVTVISRPTRGFEPTVSERLLVERCGDIIDIRERRAPCVVEALKSILLR